MMHRTTWMGLLMIFVFGISSGAAAQKPPPAAVQHESLFSSMDHLRVEFDQKIYTALRKRERKRSGIAYFSKPSSFLWQFYGSGSKQIEEEYYFDGKNLSHFVAADNLVSHYGQQSGLQKELEAVVSLILDAKKLFNQYSVAKTSVEGTDTKLQLLPLTPGSSDIASIDVTVANQPKYLKYVKLTYSNQNYTAFEFKNPVTSPIATKTYHYQNPGSVKEKHIN